MSSQDTVPSDVAATRASAAVVDRRSRAASPRPQDRAAADSTDDTSTAALLRAAVGDALDPDDECPPPPDRIDRIAAQAIANSTHGDDAAMTDAEYEAAVADAEELVRTRGGKRGGDASEPPDPVRLLADAMVAAALLAAPDAEAPGRADGAVAVLRAPEGWERPVADAWLRRVLGIEHTSDDNYGEDYRIRNERRRLREERPLLIFADLSGDKRRAKALVVVDAELRAALRKGRGVVVSAPEGCDLPQLLTAAADVRVNVPPPTPAMLAALGEAVASGCAPAVDTSVAQAVKPDHLVAALRPGQAASDFLARVTRLVAAERPSVPAQAAPRWTLDTLPLPAEAEAWGRQLASDLRAWAAGTLPWADVASAALLAGPPGCGKTTFAGALAASCGVPLIATSYARMESGEDGKGSYHSFLSTLRATFAKARAAAPCVLFLDEADSFLGRGQAGHNESWFAPLINALLTECDHAAREGVALLAATNYPERIDAALRRSGRFDRLLRLSAPDAATMARVVAAHLPGMTPAECAEAATRLDGRSGADAERFARGAHRRARTDGRTVALADLLAEVGEGRQLRSAAATRRVAFHEAGHALVVLLRRPGALTGVSIAGSGSIGGIVSWSADRCEDTAADIDALLRELLAGRAAEQVALGEASAGSGGPAGSDLAMATVVAASAEMSWGFRSLLWRGDPDVNSVPGMLAAYPEVSASVEARLEASLAAARAILVRERPALDALAEALIARETLTGAEAEGVVREARAPVRAVGKRAPASQMDAPEMGGPR